MQLGTAVSLLRSGECTVVFFDGERVIKSAERGIKPLADIISRGEDVAGMSVADKIVGRAAALLYAYMRVGAVHGCVMSEGALNVLRANGIAASFDMLTRAIINRRGDGPCPMEQAVSGTDDPATAVELVSAKIASWGIRRRT